MEELDQCNMFAYNQEGPKEHLMQLCEDRRSTRLEGRSNWRRRISPCSTEPRRQT